LALDGLIELETLRGNVPRVSSYLTYQEALYNAYEGDTEKALQTARALAAYESAHGQEQLLPLVHKAIGDDLRRLGRLKEGIAEFHEAERLAPALGTAASKTAYTEGWYGNLWLDTVKAQIELPDLEAAQNEARDFQGRVQASSPRLRAQARIGLVAVALAQGKYTAALDGVREARALLKDTPEKTSMDLDAAVIVGTVIQDTIGTLEYSEAVATATRIAAEFGDLNLGVEALARTSLLIRRRLSGDLDGVLRELTAELEEARTSGDDLAQISALQALARVVLQVSNADKFVAEPLSCVLRLPTRKGCR
jgi:tetratricopeptide (TPR) repeat protein